MPKQDALVFALAALWGALGTWIFTWIKVPILDTLMWASEPALKGFLHNGWTGDQVRPYFLWVTWVLPALFYGLIFGFPLGLLIERSIIVTWAIFVGAFVATIAVRAQVESRALLGWLVHPSYWLMALAILLFLFLGRRLRSARVLHRSAT